MSHHLSALCLRKKESRKKTIIEPFKKLFKGSLDPLKQYWTLAGPCFDESGNLGEHSELKQVIDSGLIKPNQYHGIDNSLEIIEKNKKTLKKTLDFRAKKNSQRKKISESFQNF